MSAIFLSSIGPEGEKFVDILINARLNQFDIDIISSLSASPVEACFLTGIIPTQLDKVQPFKHYGTKTYEIANNKSFTDFMSNFMLFIKGVKTALPTAMQPSSHILIYSREFVKDAPIRIAPITETLATLISSTEKLPFVSHAVIAPTKWCSEISKWLDYHSTNTFDDIEEARTLITILLDTCQTIASLPPSEGITNDITEIKNIINPDIPILSIPSQLKFNNPEIIAYSHAHSLPSNKLIQLLLIRVWLFDKTTLTTKASDLVNEFNEWLDIHSIPIKVIEIGKMLKRLGFEPKRMTNGINWLQVIDKKHTMNLISGINTIRETDWYIGDAPMFLAI